MTAAPRTRRILLALAVGAPVLALLLVAYLRAHSRDGAAHGAGTADRGALQVRMGETGPPRLDPKAALRCFAGGRFVGDLTLADCARRNGVETGRLGVGVDSTGQVAAATLGAALAPLPEAAPSGADGSAAPAGDRPPAEACLRYGPGGWREAGVGLTLRACARVLFENRCVRPGEAVYGRYGVRTLRLVPGRVEQSSDDRSFTPLMSQDAEACSLDG